MTPPVVGYATTFDVTLSAEDQVIDAMLIRPAAVTHTNDMEQRCIHLAIIDRGQDRVTVRSPPDATIAPPGYYMLFILDARRLPSVGRFLRIGR